MSVISELKNTLFGPSDFLEKLVERRNTYGAYEDTFLGLLAEEVTSKFSNYRVAISLRFKQIVTPSYKKPEELLGVGIEKLRERICWPAWLERAQSNTCKNKKCFDGEFLRGNEVDALIVRDGVDFCFVEYEKDRSELCDDFMKMYWLRQLFDRPFESLFVTQLTTRRGDGTFDEFARYVARARPLLNCLLGKWAIMEIVDLPYELKRHLNWEV
jgi:hypothetical protein